MTLKGLIFSLKIQFVELRSAFVPGFYSQGIDLRKMGFGKYFFSIGKLGKVFPMEWNLLIIYIKKFVFGLFL